LGPILGVINPKLGELVLCIDVNDLDISVVLLQERQVIVYELKKLTHVKLKCPTHKKRAIGCNPCFENLELIFFNNTIHNSN